MVATNPSLAALTAAALALPGISSEAQAASPVLSPEAEFNFAYYNENGRRMAVEIYQIDAKAPVGSEFELSFHGVKDVISGASPIFNLPDITTESVPQSPRAAPTVHARSSASIIAVPIIPRPTPPLITTPTPDIKPLPEPIIEPTPVPIAEPVVPSDSEPTPAPISKPIADPVTPPTHDVPQQLPLQTRYVFGPVRQQFTTQGFTDERNVFDTGFSYFIGDHKLTLNGGASHENDYVSNYGSATWQGEFNDKTTTVSFGFSYLDDTVRAINRPWFSAGKTSRQYLLSVAQVLSKTSLLQSSLNFSVDQGFLSDPYKRVYIADTGIVDDQRPNERYQWAWFNRYVQHIPALDAALHFDYRFGFNDWRVAAHTFQIAWYQPLGQQWQLALQGRYYTQSSASFYQPYFLTHRDEGTYSSDYRLAAFGALSGGIKLIKQFTDIPLKTEIAFDYYRRQAEWAFNGSAVDAFADYSFTLASVTLSYRF